MVGNESGNGAISFHWDGVQLSQVSVPGVSSQAWIEAIAIAAADDAWAAGWDVSAGHMFIVRWNGQEWLAVSE
jgi:hypothetical protein